MRYVRYVYVSDLSADISPLSQAAIKRQGHCAVIVGAGSDGREKYPPRIPYPPDLDH